MISQACAFLRCGALLKVSGKLLFVYAVCLVRRLIDDFTMEMEMNLFLRDKQMI